METNLRQSAADMVECAPKIGGLAVGVMENNGRGIQFLREPDAALEAQPFALLAGRNPRERNMGTGPRRRNVFMAFAGSPWVSILAVVSISC